MPAEIHHKAYLSLDVPLAGALRSVQEAVCARYALAPRPEAHLTLAYFGKTPAPKLAAFAAALQVGLPSPAIARIRLEGLGGAYEVAGETRLIGDEEPERLGACTRVLWLAAQATAEMHELRVRARHAAVSLGLDTTCFDVEFSPHLTLGSFGPVDTRPGEGTDWDVHTVRKRATIAWTPIPEYVEAAKLHFAADAVHPGSLHLLCAFSGSG